MPAEHKKSREITAEDVQAYLQDHPEFFLERDDLLAELTLPHQSGDAISLLERQVAVLRDRNMEMRQRLKNLIGVARDNDQLFERTRTLVLAMLEAGDIRTLVATVETQLREQFGADECRLTLFDSAGIADAAVEVAALAAAKEAVGGIISNRRAVCGALRAAELDFLFGNAADGVASAAVSPLTEAEPIGVLAIGSTDPQRYRSSMGTIFLSYVSEVLVRVVASLRNRSTRQ